MAAAAAAWGAWPRPPAGHALVSQVGVITTVLVLAGLPLLARRFFGPASESRAGRFLRVGWYAAIPALLPALAIIGVFAGAVPRQAGWPMRTGTRTGSWSRSEAGRLIQR